MKRARRTASSTRISTAVTTSSTRPTSTPGASRRKSSAARLRAKRDSVVIATKGRMPQGPGPNDVGLSRVHLTRALEASLRRLGTDYIDLYQVHAPEPSTPIEETMSTLDGFVRAGKVRYIGCSNFSGSQIVEAQWAAERMNGTPFVSLQPRYSLIAREIERDVLGAAERHGLGTMIYSPLGGGVLTGKYKRGEDPPADSRIGRRMAAWRPEPAPGHADRAERPQLRHRRSGREGGRRAGYHAHRGEHRVDPRQARCHHGDHRPPHVRPVRREPRRLRPRAPRRRA